MVFILTLIFSNFRNTDSFDRIGSEDNGDVDGDEREDEDDAPSGFGHVDGDMDCEEDPPEWEMGIRRSNQATVSSCFMIVLTGVTLVN